ncbi:MAG: alpha/beta hydrolase, partial [Candidatus Heimdallarchaeota archaeon]|nr:alpha/beta hydrolase [Candidatus Heimdallarchaeota archaeon]
ISTKIYYNKEEIFVFEKGIGTETILVVHGWGSSSYRMRAIIDILVSSGYRVITFDQPAHGLSTGKQTNIVEITDIIFHLEQKYGAFYAAIGHSFGGASLFYALKRGFHLNKIITISSSTRMDNLIRTFGILLSIPPELEAYIVERIEKITGHPYNEISSSNMILSKDIEYYIFHDRDDQMVPYQDSVILQNNNPQIKLTFTEGDGHRGILKNNEVQDQIIQFLSETVLISIK